jgi:superfamily I DNA/RNA helicase
MQLNPAHPSLRMHRIDTSRDRHFWSVRVNQDIRIVVHQTDTTLTLCYVDHHIPAYRWAERRKLEAHPKTGALQLVEFRETVREIVVPVFVEGAKPSKPALFGSVSDDSLLSFGVPVEVLDEVRGADEDSFFGIAARLPAEAAEALLQLAVGEAPSAATVLAAGQDPLFHPDSRRRFVVVADSTEMAAALEYPWDQWMLYLHPTQRQLVEATLTGPFRIGGSAGTGKTIVALHRAVQLLRRYPEHRVLLTTFSETLAERLREQVRKLLTTTPSLRERLEVQPLAAMASRLYGLEHGAPKIAAREQILPWLEEAAQKHGATRFSSHFLWSEWLYVVDGWQLTDWESYRVVPRIGRKTRLAEAPRRLLWDVFAEILERLRAFGMMTEAQIYAALARDMHNRARPPYEHIVVDEAQDISIPQLRFLAAIGLREAEGLFFAGDLGQRIFQPAFSWKAVGVDIRGRSRVLKVNYRTSHEIRRRADGLLAPEVSDVDGNIDSRLGTTSVFNGPEPEMCAEVDQRAETATAVRWLRECLDSGIDAGQIGVFVRSEAEFPRAEGALQAAGIEYVTLDRQPGYRGTKAALATMHLAKGLEFRAVAVMCCDDDVIPSSHRVKAASDPAELEEIVETEGHLLYVACTRARERLLVTGVAPVSEFVRDLQQVVPLQRTA